MLSSRRERFIDKFPIDPNWRDTNRETLAIFDSLDGWSSMGGVLDTVNQYQGKDTVQFTGAVHGTYTFPAPIDLSNVDYFDFTLKLNRCLYDNQTALFPMFYDGVNWSGPDLRIRFPLEVQNNFATVRTEKARYGATIDWSSITQFRISMMNDTAEPPFQVNLARIDAICVDKAIIQIDFDDNRDSVYNTAFPIMKNLGLPGSTSVITNSVSNWDNLHEMSSSGWFICNHGYTHMSMGGSNTDDEKIVDFMRGKEMMIRQGFEVGARFYSLPGGARPSTEKVKNALIKENICNRLLTTANNPYLLIGEVACNSDGIDTRALSVSSDATAGHTLADAKAWVDGAIQNRMMLRLLFHGIVDTPTIYTEWAKADFQALCEYIAEKRDLGLVEVSTIDKLFIPYSGEIIHAKGKDYLIGEGRNTKVKIELP